MRSSYNERDVSDAREVRHGAPRRMRFRNPLDFTWISDFRMDFRMDFWISKWISGFHLNRYYSEDTAKIYSWFMNCILLSLYANRITKSKALHRYIAHRQRVRWLSYIIHTRVLCVRWSYIFIHVRWLIHNPLGPKISWKCSELAMSAEKLAENVCSNLYYALQQ